MVNPQSSMLPAVIRRTVLRINALARAANLDMVDVVVIMALEPPGMAQAALEVVTNLPRRTLRRHLDRLTQMGLVAWSDGLWIRTPLLMEASDEFYRFLYQRELDPAEFGEWLNWQRKGA